MRVEFEFDKNRVAELGYTMGQIGTTLEKAFKEKGLQFATKEDIIICKDNDNRSDYSFMWSIILRLLETKWFVATATACLWYDEEEPDEEPEDVLAQAWKLATF